MAKKDNMAEEAVKKGVKRAALHGLFAIVTNPVIGIPLLIIIAAVVIYTLYSMDVQLSAMLRQYQSLSAKRTDSKASFDKKLSYLSVDDNGNLIVTIGYRSEIQQQQAEEAFAEAEYGAGGGGNTSPSSTGVFEKLAETSGTYNFNGQALNIMCDNGQEFPVYNGIPAEWGWDTGTNATVWHYQNTAAAWVANFGEETGTTSISTYRTLNREYKRSTLTNFKGVQCLQICSTAAIRKCGFTPSNTPGANDVFEDARNVEAVIIVLDKDTGNYYYIPSYVTDTKAHTYPGGIVQTTCARYSNFKQCYDPADDSCSDFGKGHAALHTSGGHYDYSDRQASVEIESNWVNQPIKSNWEIVDVIIRVK